MCRYGVKSGMTFHTLRHTLNTEAARLGFSAKTLQLLGGWKMADHYSHMAGTDKKKPLERVARHMERALSNAGRTLGGGPKVTPEVTPESRKIGGAARI